LRRSFEVWGIPVSQLLERQHERILSLAGRERIPCHGDLWAGNVIGCDDRYAIIDWDDFQQGGFPLHDLFHFHLYDRQSDYWMLMIAGGKEGLPHQAVDELAISIGILQQAMPEQEWSLERLSALFVLYLLENLARRTLCRSVTLHQPLSDVRRLLERDCLPGMTTLWERLEHRRRPPVVPRAGSVLRGAA
jgi:hypothetical protein